MTDKKKDRPHVPGWQIKYVILLSVFSSVVSLDQWTKHLIRMNFALGQTLPLVSNFFNITYVQNTGAAFGVFAQANPRFRVPFFIIVPLIALGSVAYLFKKISNQDKKLALAFSLIISGAIGNLMDRFFLGYVVDFLDFHWHWRYHFPAFNVADSAICIGVSIILLDLLLQKEALTHHKGTSPHASHSH